jgi:hypothetical protein
MRRGCKLYDDLGALVKAREDDIAHAYRILKSLVESQRADVILEALSRLYTEQSINSAGRYNDTWSRDRYAALANMRLSVEAANVMLAASRKLESAHMREHNRSMHMKRAEERYDYEQEVREQENRNRVVSSAPEEMEMEVTKGPKVATQGSGIGKNANKGSRKP